MIKYLTPFAWVDEENNLHVDCRLACLHFGVPPTTANQDLIEEVARKVVGELWPRTPQATVIRGGQN